MNNFIFYDTETSGVKEIDFIQVIQFGSIQTNGDFKVLDTLNELCAPLPWTLVTPKALTVNKKSEIFESDICHYELISNIHKTWNTWLNYGNGLFITYNGIRFDEEVMRRQFYWNLYDPYFTNTNGNSRLDLFIKMAVVLHFYHTVFPIPVVDNQTSLKLEHLADSLDIDTDDAHDALADCHFLVQLMKKIKELLPNYYEEIINTTSKESLINSLKKEDIFYHCNYLARSKKTSSYPFYPILDEYSNTNRIAVFNLNFDPELYFDLSYQELEQLLQSSKDSPFRKLAVNKTLPIISLSTLITDDIVPTDINTFKTRATLIKENINFQNKIIDILNNTEFPSFENNHIEQQIYSNGFPSAIDKDRFSQFHDAITYEEKIKLVGKIEDTRYQKFAYRICAQLFPDRVNQKILVELNNLVKERFNETGPWPDSQKNLEEAEELLSRSQNQEEKTLLNIAINSIKTRQ